IILAAQLLHGFYQWGNKLFVAQSVNILIVLWLIDTIKFKSCFLCCSRYILGNKTGAYNFFTGGYIGIQLRKVEFFTILTGNAIGPQKFIQRRNIKRISNRFQLFNKIQSRYIGLYIRFKSSIR